MMKSNVGSRRSFSGSDGRALRLLSGIIPWAVLFSIIMAVPSVQESALAQDSGSTLPSISEEPIDRAQAYYERAQLLESWKMWDKAIEEYQRVLDTTDFGPHRAGSYYGMAFCLFRLGKYQEALDALKQIQAEDMPDSSMKERIENARQKIQEAMSENPQEDPRRP